MKWFCASLIALGIIAAGAGWSILMSLSMESKDLATIMGILGGIAIGWAGGRILYLWWETR